ncbi:MAG TPA: AAA family ATPase, partial [Burkholderiaceae bacterium]
MPPSDSTAANPQHPPAFDARLIGMRFVRDTPRFAVYEGHWGDGGPRCVAKVGRDAAYTAVARADFRAEARTLTLLEPVAGVPRLLHLDIAGPTLVKTRAAGEPLARLPAPWLREVSNALRWGIALADVLGNVHAARVFHGNLDPESVCLDVATGQVTLTNFGDAVTQSHIDLDYVHPALLARTLAFGAPEQSGRMGRAVDYRADLYALGALLYWAVTGHAPFEETEPLALLHALLTRTPAVPQTLNPAVPAVLSATLLKLLAKDPQARYQSAHGVSADLRSALAGLDARDLRGRPAAFSLGASDHRIQPAQPSRLFGREAELARLERALDGSAERGRVVLVRGFSGAGKTTLVRGLYPALSARGGIFAAGRYDEYQRLTPFSGLAQALSDLADYWLAETPADLLGLRAQLHAALGSNAAALARLAPPFARVLWPPHCAPPDDGAASSPMRQRLQRALAALFLVIRERGQPVVLFIDNLQWADAGSLDLFEAAASAENAVPPLLIGAYRSNEVDAAHPLAAALARLRETGAELVDIVAGNLDAPATHELVADVLAGTPSDQHGALGPLAHALHRRTEGNPFFALQYLRRLCEDGQLRSVGGRWQWDAAALDALPGSENVVADLLRELRRLPADVRHLAGGCACLGGAIDVDILAAATGAPAQRIDAWLTPLLQRDILLTTTPADVLDAQGATLQARGGARRLRFCHDRMQQAAYASLDEAERVRWHIAIARELGRRAPVSEGPAAPRFSAANHYALSIAAITAPDEAQRVFELLLAAARDALASAGFEPALRFVHGAQALAARLPADAPRALALELTHHRALCGLALHEQADASFAALVAIAGDDSVAIADAVLHQASAAAGRMQWREAVELALRHAAALGIAVPGDDAVEAALETEIDALYAALAARGADVFERLAPATDARAAAAVDVLFGVVAPALRAQPLMARWAVARGLRVGLEHGHSRQFPAMLASVGMVLGPRRGDRATSYALARSALRLSEHYPDPWRAARTRFAATADASYWFEPVERTALSARSAMRDLAEAGDGQYVAFCWTAILTDVTESSPQLSGVFGEIDAAYATSRRLRETFGPTVYLPVRQFARCMAGRTQPPGSFGDAEVDEAALPARFGPNRRALARFGTYRGLAAAIFGDWPAALHFSRLGRDAAGAFPIGFPDLLLHWVHAISLAQALRVCAAEARAALRQEVAVALGRFAEHALECPANYGHMSDLLRALVGWADADFLGAAEAFEAAIDGAHAHHRPYHHALALELAARFYAAQRLNGAARAYFARAFAAFEAWGAHGKLPQMRADPLFTGAPPAQAALDDGVASARHELIGQAEAAQVLAHERDPEALTPLLFDLVRRYAAAERGRLFWFEDGGWIERAGFAPGVQWIGMLGSAPMRPASEAAVPDVLLNYLTQSLQPLLLRDVPTHSRFGRDAQVAQLAIKSIVALPIHHHGQAVGLLYLENRQAHTELAPPHLET